MKGFRGAINKAPGDGILRRHEAAEIVFTPEGWIMGGVRLGVAGALSPRGNLEARVAV